MLLHSTPNLQVHSQPKPFALLQPRFLPAREIGVLVDVSCWDDAMDTVFQSKEVIALDFETRGTEPGVGDNCIIGMGVASEQFCYYFHRSDNPDAFDSYLEQLSSPTSGLRFIAHNVPFDGSWIYEQFGVHAPFEACTYGLYRHLSTEGWPGQRWGLKDAMQDLLLWSDTNEAGIDDWLRSNGHVNGAGNVLKGEMWRVPAEILGSYCLLDAEATYLLYTEILRPVLTRFPALSEYHQHDFMLLVRLLIEQKQAGILVDRDQLLRADSEIRSEILELERWVREESELAKHIAEWEEDKWKSFLSTAPAQYKKKKLSPEPSKFRKDGTVSTAWLKWSARAAKPSEISKTWINWEIKREKLEKENGLRFNLRSGDALRWLFFDRLGYAPLEFTDGGLPTADIDSLATFGAGGQAIGKLLLAHKELSFVTDYLQRTQDRPTVHPGFRVPGTLTGRLSGVSPNIQQVPKSRRFLSALMPRPGKVWIDADFTALEPVVTTELSGDPGLLAVFGPHAKPGADIYLHTGLGVEAFRDEILAAGYDPEGPLTKETAAEAKKKLKRVRSICKVLYLSSQYGAFPKKIRKTLQFEGIELTLDEVTEMRDQFWEYYAGVKRWESQLRGEWRLNKGWVLNGIGRPIGIHDEFLKDVCNRVVQSTGHDLLIRYIRYLNRELALQEISYTPIVIDFHDELLIEVDAVHVLSVQQSFRTALDKMNRDLAGTIPLRINPVVVSTFADAKLES